MGTRGPSLAAYTAWRLFTRRPTALHQVCFLPGLTPSQTHGILPLKPCELPGNGAKHRLVKHEGSWLSPQMCGMLAKAKSDHLRPTESGLLGSGPLEAVPARQEPAPGLPEALEVEDQHGALSTAGFDLKCF